MLPLAFAAIYKVKNIYKPIFWLGITAYLAIEFLSNFYNCANHHFVLLYLCLATTIALAYKLDFDKILNYNARWILGVVFLFAALHKILSAEFIDGSYLGFTTVLGGFAKPLHIFDSYDLFVNENAAVYNKINESVPRENNQGIFNTPFDQFINFIKSFTWVTIAAEVFVAALFAFKPSRVSHMFMLLFLATLVFTRSETGFASILCLLGMASCNDKFENYKLFYLIAFVICLTASFTKFGYI
ncbi:hypothetical protein BST97_02840 [Nonlabens spongiae]|uniref:Uncharacterized protein n=1 Tax=Nonlabens spongiae TaxID=331648 RepID=A0A1W6MHG5_9FLAO|nr:hypothetical protein BST97_02840 [Nonlabens spongiae]